MIVLDTNVISEVSRQAPNAACVGWLSGQRTANLFLTDVTIMELAYGAEKHFLKTGSSRYIRSLRELTEQQYFGRVLTWGGTAVSIAGQMIARRGMAGFSIAVSDAIIAAICLSHGATLATRNTKDFEGLDISLINPFEEH